MAVAFDAVGPSSSGQTNTSGAALTWSHTITGANTVLLAAIALGIGSGDGALSTSATYNGNAMTSLGKVHSGGLAAGYVEVFGIVAPAGTANVVITPSGGTPASMSGGSISFTGAAQTVATAFGTPTTANTPTGTAAPSATTAGSTTGNMMAGFACAGQPFNTATSPSTSRFMANSGSSSSAAGSGAGATSPSTGSAVTMAWSLMAADDFGEIIVEVQAASDTVPMAVSTTFAGSPAGADLKVMVLTGATEAGGANAAFSQSSTGSAASWSLTPNGSNSLPLFIIYDQSGGTSGQYTAAANNTLIDNSIQHDAFCDGYYSGTVTAGTPITMGTSGPTTTKQAWASYEVLSSGASTPVQDASTPAVAVSATNTATTASFNAPAGAVIVAMSSGNNALADGTISDTSGLGLTWTLRSSTTGSGNTTDIWTTTVPSGGGGGGGGTDSGPNSPSTGTDLGGGTGSWTSPGNITADDGSAAVWTVS